MVLESTTTVPFCNACAAPFCPNSTCSTALVSETHIHTTSFSLTASAGVDAVFAPATSLPGVRFQTVISCPALTRLEAIGRPIIPIPTKAMRMFRIKSRNVDCVKGTESNWQLAKARRSLHFWQFWHLWQFWQLLTSVTIFSLLNSVF